MVREKKCYGCTVSRNDALDIKSRSLVKVCAVLPSGEVKLLVKTSGKIQFIRLPIEFDEPGISGALQTNESAGPMTNNIPVG